MIRVKKTCETDIRRLERNIAEGSRLVNFQVLNNGNVAMIFELLTEKENEIRYTIKIHNRLGIQRQCSFTALDSKLENIFMYMNELYAIMSEGEKLSVNRLEPDTRENLFPLYDGNVSRIVGISKDSFIIVYDDGRIVHYLNGKAEELKDVGAAATVSLDFNRRYMTFAGGEVTRYDERGIRKYSVKADTCDGFLLARGDRNFAVCTGGRLVEFEKDGETFVKKDDILDLDIAACSMVKDTAALYDGNVIYVYKMM